MQALLFPSQKIPALNLLFRYFKKQNKFTYNFVANVHSFHQTLNFPLNIPSLKLQRKFWSIPYKFRRMNVKCKRYFRRVRKFLLKSVFIIYLFIYLF